MGIKEKESGQSTRLALVLRRPKRYRTCAGAGESSQGRAMCDSSCQRMKTERLLQPRQFHVVGISIFAKDMSCHDFFVTAHAEREVDHSLPRLRHQSPALHGDPSCPYEGALGCFSPETVCPERIVGCEDHDDPPCVLPRSRVFHQSFPCPFDHFDFRNGDRG
jgi:hypothetical protein